MKINEVVLSERFVNLIGRDPKKEKYADTVYKMIQQSYTPIGGMKGSGFSSPEDMIASIPFWKVVKREGEVVAVALYKDHGGRKRVAVATNGTPEGKSALGEIMEDDLDRAFFEVSGPSLRFMVEIIGTDKLKKYAKTPTQSAEILGDEVFPVGEDEPETGLYPQLADYFYKREIGGHLHTKIMLGTSGKKIINVM